VGRLARTGRPARPSWRRLEYAQSEPEADMLVDVLRQHGVPAFARATSFAEVTGFPVACGRVLLVPSERLLDARAVLECMRAGGAFTRPEPEAQA
jgi:hypothetical protein